MLARFRDRARWISGIALASALALVLGSALPHPDDCHGAACRLDVAPHDASSHSIGRSQDADSHPLHCVLCHWNRSVRPLTTAAYLIEPAGACTVRIALDAFSTLSPFPSPQPPLRAPPASPIV